ncbi:putative UbiX-like flavin prenyltransferase [Shouchella clausii]|uniref:Probable UbiX-like flavin prenyltransferase n=2 Tax=Shouchella TaxID=2893057 RepID=Q5WKD3_SHOC1|nr:MULTISPECIES: non-oxidative hydroxyarylic acid decarboxylases subunit B [Shouchella]MBX0317235.1 UbiX family flavin prenyltransferase [Shouchella clausii]MCM3379642.1 UbiX family flavin prenyltransferase [Shouchella rhizosphaerae]MDO7269114.1 non-oxidative hydroxyarylic acid decarboxylases subunit B [Shouchella clausii]MDO7284897.1 non-oxidative hydroxyarylic acid decarboxylases subunit B [Shouchella clausii]MDO7288669.1 non-oxidative hydroxyarylic acid decarboxylases subunit B [Shouchella 
MKLIIGMTGATGAIFGIRLLQQLQKTEVESHLVMSPWAAATIQAETSFTVKDVERLADYTYSPKDLGAAVSSGSFQVDGMMIAPCSMKTLASIRTGLADNLVTRAADVMLKERKPLLLMTRETPLNDIHLENMLALSRMGAHIVPPMPAFYNQPQTIDDLVDHIVYRALDQLGIHLPEAKRWQGLKAERRDPGF